MRTLVYACGLLAVSMPLLVNAQQPALLPQSLGIKYTRDSQEYATLADAKKAGALVIGYGSFLNAIVQFLLLAFVIFLLIKQVNRLRRPAANAAPTTKDCPACCMSVPIKATRCPHCTSAIA